MMKRDSNLTDIRPIIKTAIINSNMSFDEQFQNNTLRPVIALQNNFFSHIVITAGTNRSVHIYDMNKGQRIKTMEQAHGRSVHSVVLPTLSDYTSLPNNIYDRQTTVRRAISASFRTSPAKRGDGQVRLGPCHAYQPFDRVTITVGHGHTPA